MLKKLSLLVAAAILSVVVLGCAQQDVGDAEQKVENAKAPAGPEGANTTPASPVQGN